MTDQGITLYQKQPAVMQPWDARAPVAARHLIAMINAANPQVRVEHVGSTALAGCAGKGVIDLLMMYPSGSQDLARARATLDALGFQRQSSRDPFPEERPMRVGGYAHEGGLFRIHAHVVAASALEEEDFLAFRDALRNDHALMEAYLAEKRAILVEGIMDSLDYSVRKGGFIQRWLADRIRPALSE